VTRSRVAQPLDTLTYWRGSLGREREIPERFTLREDGGGNVDIVPPFGLAQPNGSTLSQTPSGTRVNIAVELWSRTSLGRLALPLYLRYAKKIYPRTWRAAARWCQNPTHPWSALSAAGRRPEGATFIRGLSPNPILVNQLGV
jgi:hypothetical protein